MEAHPLILIFDEGKAAWLPFARASLVKQEIEFGNLAKFRENLQEGVPMREG
jgi:hypothetical protein